MLKTVTYRFAVTARYVAEIWRCMFDAAPVLATAPAEPPKESRIECAAVQDRKTLLIFSRPRPARHHDILHVMKRAGFSTTHTDNQQGFLLTDGEFALRTEAKNIAVRAGQFLPAREGMSDELFSEDVW